MVLTADRSGERADAALARLAPDLTRSAAQRLLEEGRVLREGRPLRKNDKLQAGDVLALDLPEPQPVALEPEDIPLDIVYEDKDLLVINKPKGLVVHPAAGHWSGTLVNALLYHCRDSLSGINGELRPGIVHRIDKDTSGLLIVAKRRWRRSSRITPWPGPTSAWWWAASGRTAASLTRPSAAIPPTGRKWRSPRKTAAMP